MIGERLCRRFQRFKFKYNLYKLREERAIKPSTFGRLVSATLYEKRRVLNLRLQRQSHPYPEGGCEVITSHQVAMCPPPSSTLTGTSPETYISASYLTTNVTSCT